MQQTNCAPARRLKLCWRVSLVSLWEYTEMEKRQMNKTLRQNMFRNVQTQKYKISNLAKLKLSVQTKIELIVVRQVMQSVNYALGD